MSEQSCHLLNKMFTTFKINVFETNKDFEQLGQRSDLCNNV